MTTSPPDASQQMPESLPLEAVEQVRHLVDNYLAMISDRTLVSASEVVDLLLDIRSAAMKGHE